MPRGKNGEGNKELKSHDCGPVHYGAAPADSANFIPASA
jgi:hypothetical protein